MDRPHRESRQYNGIMVRGLSKPTFATKSAPLRHASRRLQFCLAGKAGSYRPMAKMTRLTRSGHGILIALPVLLVNRAGKVHQSIELLCVPAIRRLHGGNERSDTQ